MSAVFATYLQENQIFVGLHGLLVGWAMVVWVRATRATGRDRAWLHSGNPVGSGRLASLWNQLRSTGHAGRLELRELYEAQAGVASDDLARIANLFLLSGVAGTLWSLAGGARQVKALTGEDVAAAEALI